MFSFSPSIFASIIEYFHSLSLIYFFSSFLCITFFISLSLSFSSFIISVPLTFLFFVILLFLSLSNRGDSYSALLRASPPFLSYGSSLPASLSRRLMSKLSCPSSHARSHSQWTHPSACTLGVRLYYRYHPSREQPALCSFPCSIFYSFSKCIRKWIGVIYDMKEL